MAGVERACMDEEMEWNSMNGAERLLERWKITLRGSKTRPKNTLCNLGGL